MRVPLLQLVVILHLLLILIERAARRWSYGGRNGWKYGEAMAVLLKGWRMGRRLVLRGLRGGANVLRMGDSVGPRNGGW